MLFKDPSSPAPTKGVRTCSDGRVEVGLAKGGCAEYRSETSHSPRAMALATVK